MLFGRTYRSACGKTSGDKRGVGRKAFHGRYSRVPKRLLRHERLRRGACVNRVPRSDVDCDARGRRRGCGIHARGSELK